MSIVYAIAALGVLAIAVFAVYLACGVMVSTFGWVWGPILCGVCACMALAFCFGGSMPDKGRTDR